MKKSDAAAIIVAGGSGTRFGGKVRKQYLTLAGRPLLWWSVQAFEQTPAIGMIVVVVPSEDLARMKTFIARSKLRKVGAVVAGGTQRRDSVRLGLAALGRQWRWVAVHDAVRPLVRRSTIESTLAAARRTGAALAACPSRDTVQLANAKDEVSSSPDRARVWLAQTPQIFERRLLERAHAKGRRWPVTDDVQMVRRLGARVRIVEAPMDNIKVTLPSDLPLARLLWKGHP